MRESLRLTRDLLMGSFCLCIAALSATTSAQNTIFNNSTLRDDEGRLRSSTGLFDDVLIPVSRFAGDVSEIPITSITFGMQLFSSDAPDAGSYEVFYGRMGMDDVGGNTQPVPVGDRFQIGDFADWQAGADPDGLSLVTIGDDNSTIFTLDANDILNFDGTDYYSFVIGMRHLSARSGTGWLPTLADEFNLRVGENGLTAGGRFGWSNTDSAFTISTSTDRNTMYTVVNSSVAAIPEPGTVSVLFVGTSLLLMRRRR